MRLFLLLAVLTAPLLLTACHTAEGVKEDLGVAGHAISHAASDVQKKL